MYEVCLLCMRGNREEKEKHTRELWRPLYFYLCLYLYVICNICCVEKTACPTGAHGEQIYFKCVRSGRCVPVNFMCDQHYDCHYIGVEDFSDEDNCCMLALPALYLLFFLLSTCTVGPPPQGVEVGGGVKIDFRKTSF